MPFMQHAGIDFHYREAGTGTCFVFQHGLGGDVAQPLGLFAPPPGVRVLALDCRGHGATRPLGDSALLGFASFAADVVALLDHLGVERAIVGGISMGAGVALRLALSLSLPIAGAASLGGGLPRGNCLLSRVNDARSLPLLLMTCRASDVYPPQQVADDLRLLHAAGCQLAIREYLCGDELYTDMFHDLDQWMMNQVCGAPATATAS